MAAVGVAKLKAARSAYLAQVKAGAVVVVTEHGRPIARLVPIDEAHDDADAQLAELERAGLVRRGGGDLRRCLATLPRPQDADGRLLDALLAERDEGP